MNERLCSIVMAFIIMLLSGMDAINTIYILSHGGEELNPLMGQFIKEDLSVFLWVKAGMTALFLSILVLLVKWRALLALLLIYLVLMAYQTMLIWSV